MRHKNADWNLPPKVENWEQVFTAVLMDVRDELQALNRKLECFRVRRMLDTVERVDRRLAKKINLNSNRDKLSGK